MYTFLNSTAAFLFSDSLVSWNNCDMSYRPYRCQKRYRSRLRKVGERGGTLRRPIISIVNQIVRIKALRSSVEITLISTSVNPIFINKTNWVYNAVIMDLNNAAMTYHTWPN